MKKIRPGQKIKLTSVEELLGVSNEESAMDIEVVKIQPFRNHPFKVIDDEKMEDLVYDILINCTFYKSYDIIQTRQSEGPLYEIHA